MGARLLAHRSSAHITEDWVTKQSQKLCQQLNLHSETVGVLPLVYLILRRPCKSEKLKLPSMRIELISEDIYSLAEVISEYETSVLTVKLRGRI